ncbi:hypothetical protein TNCV_3912411 [Trichonephila clavipes]|nr:hypothetical protein TNCV_3912411 [Trichonephila clavipes]
MNSLAASVKLTYSASMVDRLTDFCLKVRDEIGVPSIKVMNPPIDTRSSLFVHPAVMHVKSIERGVPAQLSPSSFDHASKLRGPSLKALV